MYKRILHRLNNYRNHSYSQSGEDLILQCIFRGLKINYPTYMDIGAYHPFKFSNTALLYLNGSRGINVEPNPVQFKKIVKSRKRDINLNIGVAAQNGFLTYYSMSETTLNTFSQQEALEYEKKGYKILSSSNIEVKSIESIHLEYLIDQKLDLLCIDTEGMEYEIFKNGYLKKYAPKVLCVETIEFSNNYYGKKNLELINVIKNNDYVVYADTHINTLFVHNKLVSQ